MESLKIYEIYDYWYRPFWEYIIIGLLALLFCVLCAGLIFWFIAKKRKQKKSAPWVYALKSLEQLDPSVCAGYAQCKEYYTQLTGILKEYFSACYALNLLDKTDFECIKILKPYLHSSVELEALEEILSGAMWAKFAPGEVMQQKMVDHRKKSISIIQSTKRECPLDISGKLEK